MSITRIICSVYILIDAPTPDIVERALGIAPDRSANIGDRAKTERADIVAVRRSTSLWALESGEHVSSSNPDAHIEWLIRTFSGADLSGIDCIKQVSVGIHIESDEEWFEFDIPEPVVQIAANLNALISLNVWCKSGSKEDE